MKRFSCFGNVYTGDMAQWVERLTLRRQRLAEDFKIKQGAD